MISQNLQLRPEPVPGQGKGQIDPDSACVSRSIGPHDVIAGLRQLGVREGDRLTVHASLSSFGHVNGGAHTIIEALLAVLGRRGTLLVPHFPVPTYAGPFDPQAPPPVWTGAVSNAAREWAGAVLSCHPSHPVVAIGPDAHALTRDHYRVSAVGVNSPVDRLAKMGGRVLLLGVTQRANTTIHTGEAHANAPYWGRSRPDRPLGRWMILPDEDQAGPGRKPAPSRRSEPALSTTKGQAPSSPKGRRIWVPLPETPGDSAGFDKIEPFLVDRGLITFGRIGRARCRLMDAQPLIEAVVAFLARFPGGLLCDEPMCRFCVWARQFVASPPPTPQKRVLMEKENADGDG